jgi:uncharacterized membrane protein YfcA
VIATELLVFAAAIGAGVFGSLVGVGGGIMLVPLLTVALGVDIKHAIAASLLGVIAVSTAAAASYLQSGLVDRRLGLTLLLATASGGIVGGYVAGLLDARVLAAMFGVVLVLVALQMLRGTRRAPVELVGEPTGLEFDSSFVEPTTGQETAYRARRVGLGTAISLVAGAISGLLGIGGGVVNVPTMNLVLGIPIRIALTTSTYMLGATAAASSVIYFSRGLVDPLLAAPVVMGVIIGARIGARLAHRLPQRALQLLFVAVSLIFAVQMLLRAAGQA